MGDTTRDLTVAHYCFAANRTWMRAVMLAGMLNTWATLLGADPGALAAAKQTACDMRRDGYTSRSDEAKAKLKAAPVVVVAVGPGLTAGPGRYLPQRQSSGRCGCISTVTPPTPACWPRHRRGYEGWSFPRSAP